MLSQYSYSDRSPGETPQINTGRGRHLQKRPLPLTFPTQADFFPFNPVTPRPLSSALEMSTILGHLQACTKNASQDIFNTFWHLYVKRRKSTPILLTPNKLKRIYIPRKEHRAHAMSSMSSSPSQAFRELKYVRLKCPSQIENESSVRWPQAARLYPSHTWVCGNTSPSTTTPPQL